MVPKSLFRWKTSDRIFEPNSEWLFWATTWQTTHQYAVSVKTLCNTWLRFWPKFGLVFFWTGGFLSIHLENPRPGAALSSLAGTLGQCFRPLNLFSTLKIAHLILRCFFLDWDSKSYKKVIMVWNRYFRREILTELITGSNSRAKHVSHSVLKLSDCRSSYCSSYILNASART